ncbi:ATP-binding protein [Acanthopleuribacter pedis]|uniref:ATP-binding protein n=1 Tax=Acanthopleuribacter pedis TaxID=442870 RepID=A0A8J7QH87_9BACT|nr:ATP-binding protein [Acanthopleuribacter pedis]MBO1320135.1 ATP-binding protein [Acanthopleuribacter pedis]
MHIKISKAIELFFPNPKLELVYFEAIANAMDAKASEIVVENIIDTRTRPTTIEIIISDNGVGFTGKNFAKFSKLLKTDGDDHKGVGRLVFLNYFDTVQISSVFGSEKINFVFDKAFEGEHELKPVTDTLYKTELHFKHFNHRKIRSYDAINPGNLKASMMRHFFPYFYDKKLRHEYLNIQFRQELYEHGQTEPIITEQSFNIDEIEDLTRASFSAEVAGTAVPFEVLYAVKKTEGPTTVVTAVCCDGQTIPLNLLGRKQLPPGTNLVFLVVSPFFKGKSDSSRQRLELEETQQKQLKECLTEQPAGILHEQVPEIRAFNQRLMGDYADRYPHLQGYFHSSGAGLMERRQVLEAAQRKFFEAQREILDADHFDRETYEKSLEISSRLLTEYLLYRNLIIKKLTEMDEREAEAAIHNAIVPMRKTLQNKGFNEHIFFNNAWLIDDKFMNFRTILSNQDFTAIAKELEIEDNEFKGKERPDITIIFSDDVNKTEKVDVVMVELKKRGLPLAGKEEVVSQLRQRARKLARWYKSKIQRIWLYGIVDFDEAFHVSLLEDQFIELYSKGNLYYREYPIIPNQEDKHHPIPLGIFVLDYQAFIKDAAARNKTFLEILKSGFAAE